MDQGLIYIFTGTGKGKTSAALGMTLRATCNNMKVAWIAWYKSASWGVSEHQMKKFLPAVDLHVLGKGFYFDSKSEEMVKKVGKIKVAKVKVGVVVDHYASEEHSAAAQIALAKAKEILEDQSVDLLVCDEICQAVQQKLISLEQVLELLSLRGRTHMILTGRDCPQALIKEAHTVTSMEKVKHAYDQEIMAVKGLDF